MTPSPIEYFHRLLTRWEGAAATQLPIERHFQIGDRHIAIRLAGPELSEAIFTALAPLESGPRPDGVPDLTVYAWDGASTGVALAAETPPSENYSNFGDRSLSRSPEASLLFHHGMGALNMVHHPLRRAVYFVPRLSALPLLEYGSPLRHLLNLYFERQDLHVVHGGAVGTENGCVLLTGRGGSGKSTTAMTCLLAGLHYLGDDYVLLQNQPEPRIHSLYCSGKLHLDHMARFPDLAAKARFTAGQTGDKALWFAGELAGTVSSHSLPPHAVVLPRVVGQGATTWRKISPAAALTALAPSTVFQLPGTGPAAFAAAAECLRRVPSFELLLGEVSGIPAGVRGLLASLAL